jgi:hypothetical protein
LETASALLSQVRPEPVIVESDVASLLEQVRALLDQVVAADGLDDGAREWIANRLQEIEDALSGIGITGCSGVERALNATIGGLRRHPTMLERLRASPVIHGIVGLLVALDLALNLAANVKALEADEVPSPSPVIVEIEQVTNVQIERVELGDKSYLLDDMRAIQSGRPSQAASGDDGEAE